MSIIFSSEFSFLYNKKYCSAATRPKLLVMSWQILVNTQSNSSWRLHFIYNIFHVGSSLQWWILIGKQRNSWNSAQTTVLVFKTGFLVLRLLFEIFGQPEFNWSVFLQNICHPWNLFAVRHCCCIFLGRFLWRNRNYSDSVNLNKKLHQWGRWCLRSQHWTLGHHVQ